MGRPKGSKNKPKLAVTESTETKSLSETLQDLVTHCKSNTGLDVNLKLRIPGSVFKEYCNILQPKERIKLYGYEENSPFIIHKMFFNGGTVELESETTEGVNNGSPS
jgi:hypothetical protein